MLLRTSVFACLALFAAVACGGEGSDDPATPGDEAAVTSAAPFAITASSVEKMNGSLSGVTPAVRTADPGHMPEFYLSRDSALGPAGPISAWGPLGALGPVGDMSWNASAW